MEQYDNISASNSELLLDLEYSGNYSNKSDVGKFDNISWSNFAIGEVDFYQLLNDLGKLNLTNVSTRTDLLEPPDSTHIQSWEGYYIDFVGIFIICLFGIISNSVAIPILISARIANLFNRTLSFLAFFDNIFLFLEIIESIRLKHPSWSGKFHLYLFPYLLYPMQNISLFCSIYTTVVITFERYLAIRRPIRTFIAAPCTRKISTLSTTTGSGGMATSESEETWLEKWGRVLTYIVPIFIFSLLFNLPTFFEFSITKKEKVLNPGDLCSPPTEVDELCLTSLRIDEDYVFYYINLTRISITVIFPLIFLCTLNYLIYRHLRKRGRSMQTSLGVIVRKKLAVEKRQGQTLFGVGFLFIFGHLPRVILNLHEFLFLSNVRNSISNCEEDQTDSALVLLPPWAMVGVSVKRLLLSMSLSSNLFVYCATSRIFRNILINKVKKIFGSND